MAELSVKGLSMSLGITFAICMLFLGLSSWLMNWGTGLVELIGVLYVGYTATPLGAIIGAIYAFIDGAIGGALIAYFYNKFQ